MNSDPLLFRYSVIAEYIGNVVYPFKKGNQVDGTLAFNFDSGMVKFFASHSDKPLEFLYPTWNKFELEWKVIDRKANE